MDKRIVFLVALFDLSTAFNTIDHNILFLWLQNLFGFSGIVLKWFCYLSGLTQCMSSPRPLKVLDQGNEEIGTQIHL